MGGLGATLGLLGAMESRAPRSSITSTHLVPLRSLGAAMAATALRSAPALGSRMLVAQGAAAAEKVESGISSGGIAGRPIPAITSTFRAQEELGVRDLRGIMLTPQILELWAAQTLGDGEAVEAVEALEARAETRRLRLGLGAMAEMVVMATCCC